MKKAITELFCDICNSKTETLIDIVYPVIFHTEQTEGKYVEPYIYNTKIEVCPNCLKRLCRLSAIGAQGYNRYSFIEDKTDTSEPLSPFE